MAQHPSQAKAVGRGSVVENLESRLHLAAQAYDWNDLTSPLVTIEADEYGKPAVVTVTPKQ